MADNNNPIKYSDLVSPDNSITDLIKQLDELSDAYTNALKNIRAEAIQLAAVLQKVSGATEDGGTQPRKPQTMRNVWHVRNVFGVCRKRERQKVSRVKIGTTGSEPN